jgi:hypothetical protein
MKLRLKKGEQSKARLRSKDLGHLQDTTKEAASGSSIMYIVDCTVPMRYAECLSQSAQPMLHAGCFLQSVNAAECPSYAEYLLQSAMLQSAQAASREPVADCHAARRMPILHSAHAAEFPSCMQSTCCRVSCCRVPKLHAGYLLQSAMLHAECLLQSVHTTECPSCMQNACCTVPILQRVQT